MGKIYNDLMRQRREHIRDIAYWQRPSVQLKIMRAEAVKKAAVKDAMKRGWTGQEPVDPATLPWGFELPLPYADQLYEPINEAYDLGVRLEPVRKAVLTLQGMNPGPASDEVMRSIPKDLRQWAPLFVKEARKDEPTDIFSRMSRSFVRSTTGIPESIRRFLFESPIVPTYDEKGRSTKMSLANFVMDQVGGERRGQLSPEFDAFRTQMEGLMSGELSPDPGIIEIGLIGAAQAAPEFIAGGGLRKWAVPYFAMSIGQHRYEEGIASGLTQEQASDVAMLTALPEALIEVVQLRQITGVGRAARKALTRGALPATRRAALLATLQAFIKNNAGEILEEGLQEVSHDLAINLAGAGFKDAGEIIEDALTTMKDSVITMPILTMGGTISNYRGQMRGVEFRKHMDTAKTLVEKMLASTIEATEQAAEDVAAESRAATAEEAPSPTAPVSQVARPRLNKDAVSRQTRRIDAWREVRDQLGHKAYLAARGRATRRQVDQRVPLSPSDIANIAEEVQDNPEAWDEMTESLKFPVTDVREAVRWLVAGGIEVHDPGRRTSSLGLGWVMHEVVNYMQALELLGWQLPDAISLKEHPKASQGWSGGLFTATRTRDPHSRQLWELVIVSPENMTPNVLTSVLAHEIAGHLVASMPTKVMFSNTQATQAENRIAEQLAKIMGFSGQQLANMRKQNKMNEAIATTIAELAAGKQIPDAAMRLLKQLGAATTAAQRYMVTVEQYREYVTKGAMDETSLEPRSPKFVSEMRRAVNLGIYHLERQDVAGGRKPRRALWNANMMADLGPGVRKHLNKIWRRLADARALMRKGIQGLGAIDWIWVGSTPKVLGLKTLVRLNQFDKLRTGSVARFAADVLLGQNIETAKALDEAFNNLSDEDKRFLGSAVAGMRRLLKKAVVADLRQGRSVTAESIQAAIHKLTLVAKRKQYIRLIQKIGRRIGKYHPAVKARLNEVLADVALHDHRPDTYQWAEQVLSTITSDTEPFGEGWATSAADISKAVSIMRDYEKTSIYKLTPDQLAELAKSVVMALNVEHITNNLMTLNMTVESAIDTIDDDTSKIKRVKDIKDFDGSSIHDHMVRDVFWSDVLNSSEYMNWQFGENNLITKLFRENLVRDGIHTQKRLFFDFFERLQKRLLSVGLSKPANYRAWTRKLVKAKIGNVTVEVPRDRLAGLYATLQRRVVRDDIASKGHVGIKFGGVARVIPMTMEQIQDFMKWASTFEGGEIAKVADAITETMREVYAGPVRETFLRAYGYEPPMEEDYYTSFRDEAVIPGKTSFATAMKEGQLHVRQDMSRGHLKPKTSAKDKPYVIHGALNVANYYNSTMSVYCGLQPAAWDIANILSKPETTKMLQKYFGTRWKAVKRRMLDTMRAVVGSEVGDVSKWNKMIKIILRAGHVATLGLKPRIAFYQTVSALQASTMPGIRFRDIVKGFTKRITDDEWRMLDNPYIEDRVRHSGYAILSPTLTTDTGPKAMVGIREWWPRRIGMAPIVAMDRATITGIVRASLARAERRGLKGAEKWKAASRLAEDTIRQTQPTWDPFSISAYAQKGRQNWGYHLLTLYSSQTNKNFNMVMAAIRKWHRGPKDAAAFKRLVGGVTIPTVANSAIVWGLAAGNKVLLDVIAKGFGERPDETDALYGIMDRMIGNWLIAREVVPIRAVYAAVTSKPWEVGRVRGNILSGAIQDAREAVFRFTKAYESDIYWSGARRGKWKRPYELEKGLFATARVAILFFGVPLQEVISFARVRSQRDLDKYYDSVALWKLTSAPPSRKRRRWSTSSHSYVGQSESEEMFNLRVRRWKRLVRDAKWHFKRREPNVSEAELRKLLLQLSRARKGDFRSRLLRLRKRMGWED